MKPSPAILTSLMVLFFIRCGNSTQPEQEKNTDSTKQVSTNVPPPPSPPENVKWLDEYCVQLKLTRDSLNLTRDGKKTFFQDMDSFEKYLKSGFSKDCDIAFIIGFDAGFEHEKKISELLNQLDLQYAIFQEEMTTTSKDSL